MKKYDYSQAGYYFVTVCTAVRRENILAEILPDIPAVGAAALGGPSPVNDPVPKVVLTAAGEIVEGLIGNIDHVYHGRAGVDCHVVMPDHIHMVIWLRGREDGPPRAAAPTASLPGIINTLKGLSSKKMECPIWQRGYYEHIIRTEKDLQDIRQYIQNNPLQWLLNQNQDVPAL